MMIGKREGGKRYHFGGGAGEALPNSSIHFATILMYSIYQVRHSLWLHAIGTRMKNLSRAKIRDRLVDDVG